jgi:hypothetical protein
MRKLPKLWRSLDRIAGQLAVPAVWEVESGEDFEFLRPHLRPTDMVGALYPCPHRYGYCPRKIVDYGDGEFAALCRDPHESCERVSLTAREALLHELDLASFLQPILRAASIRHEQPKKRGFGTWSLGLSTRRSSMNQPAFLIIAHGTEIFESAVNDLLLDVAGQFLIMAPTNGYRSVRVQERLQARNIGYVCLDEQLGVDEDGCFVSVDPLDSADRIPATPVADRKRVVAEFRAKHGCKVAEIHEAAGVHEADYYKWLNGSIPDHYSTCVAIEKVLVAGIPKRGKRMFS